MKGAALFMSIGVVIVVLLMASFVVGLPTAGLSFPVYTILLVIANIALVVGSVASILTRKDLTGIQRLIWLAIAVLVTPVVALGAILYFALGRERTSALFRDVGREPVPDARPGAPR